MPRVLLVVAWIAVVVYAIADCFRTPEEECPARLPKPMWLLIILITIPSFAVGSVAWIILRVLARVEAGQSPLPPLPRPRSASTPPQQPRSCAPDDDPEFLFTIKRDIQREKRRQAQARTEGDASGASASDSTSTPGKENDTPSAEDEGRDTSSKTPEH